MVVVKRDVSKLKGHLNAIGEALKEIFKPNTMTIHYPKEMRMYENIRGYIQIDLSKCIGCARCARICPSNAIVMKKFGGRYYPTIDYGRCIFCHFCVDVCPTGVIVNSKIHDLSFDNPNIVLNPNERVKDRKIKGVTYEFKGDIKVKR
jgi:NADH-quinone oxidoreductase subunit I